MTHPTLSRRTTGTAAAALTLGLVLAGCGGSSDEAGGEASGSSDPGESAPTESLPTVEADEALAAMVPDAVKEDGKLTVGSDTTYAPAEFVDADGTTVVGYDVDLFKLVAQKLDLEAEFVTAPFDSIIAGVGSGKFEAGVSAFTINPERQEVASMISYFDAGTQWTTKKGNPAEVDPDNACGKRIGVQKASIQVEDITARSQKCEADGEPAIIVEQYSGQDKVTAAVVSGKNDANLADSPVAGYAASQTNGQLETLGEVYDSAPYGYVVPKDQTELAQALAGAVQQLIDDGSYEEVLTNWGVESGGISESVVDPQVG